MHHPNFHLTKQAYSFLKKKPYTNFLLELKGKGCNGFSFSLLPATVDIINHADYAKKNFLDLTIIYHKDELYINNLTIDLESDVMSEKIVFIVPEASSHCGCGESFFVKGEL